MPNVDYERELLKEESNLQREVEKYKQEVLEGLQIEEEGLTEYIRTKTKQPSIFVTQRNYNDPIDNDGVIDETSKKNQMLNSDLNKYKVHEQQDKRIRDDVQERLVKTQSNNREIYETARHELDSNEAEITTQSVKFRHSRRSSEYSKNKKRAEKKRHRRKHEKRRGNDR